MNNLNSATYVHLFAVIFLVSCRAEPTKSVACNQNEIATEQGCKPVVSDGGMPIGPMVTLPMPVDHWYVPSGYMGDGEDPEALYLSPPLACPMRGKSDAVGDCHRFEYRPGPVGHAGVFWQYPANNWGESGLAGLSIPAGAQSIRFMAWTDEEPITVKFMAGISEVVDGFSIELSGVEVTNVPQTFTLDVRNIGYGSVIGAFGWYMEGNSERAVINIDDIHWSEELPLEQPPPRVPALPLAVNDWFAPSGYMGDGENAEGLYLSAPQACDDTETLDSTCTQFTYTTGPVGGAGVFWQYPANNWGLAGDECDGLVQVCDVSGLDIPSGARSIAFTAWTNREAHDVTFLAGISTAVDGFSVSKTFNVGSDPKDYTLDLRDVEYGAVIGGFGWYTQGDSEELSLRIKDIVWRTEPPIEDGEPTDNRPEVPSHPDAPLTLPYPLLAAFGPSGVMPAAAANMVDIAGCTPEESQGLADCVVFTTTPGSSSWAGVWWHTMANGWMGPPADIPSGANGLSFYAWSDQANIRRKFGVGDLQASDSFAVELSGAPGINGQGEFPLEQSPQRYGITFPTEPENLVGGLFWAGPIVATADAPVKVFVAQAEYVAALPADIVNGESDETELTAPLNEQFQNGGFENDIAASFGWLTYPSNWTGHRAIRRDELGENGEPFIPKEGDVSYRLTHRPNQEVSFYQELVNTNPQANSESLFFEFSVWTYQDGSNPFSAGQTARAFIKFFSRDYTENTLVYSDSEVIAESELEPGSESELETWIEHKVCTVTPDAEMRPRVQVGIQLNSDGNTGGVIFVDDARLQRVESCPSDGMVQ